MAFFFLIPAKEKCLKDDPKQALQCLQLPQSSRQRTKQCWRVSRFSKICREAHTEINNNNNNNDSAHCTGTNRISNRIDIPQLPLSVLLRMCFGLETKPDWSYRDFQFSFCRMRMSEQLTRLRFIISLRIPLPWTLTFTLTQFFVCNRLAVTKLIQYASKAVLQNTCVKRTSTITCIKFNCAEMRAYCRQLWIRLVTKMFLSIKMPFPYPLSMWSRQMHTKTIQWSSRINYAHRFTEIQNPRRKVCSECILFLKWSRDHNHWSVRSLQAVLGGFAGREGWNARTREEMGGRKNKWGQQGSRRVQKGSRRGSSGGTAVVPRFDDEREFSRKQKSILGYKNA